MEISCTPGIFPVPNSKYTVIVHHGQGYNVAFYISTAEVFRNAGASVLLYDYEGFGLSSGEPSNEALVRDPEAAYWYVRNQLRVPASRIVHCGLSLGTGAASEIASSQPCAGIVLLSPYLRLSKTAKQFLPFLRLYPEFAFPKPDVGAEDLLLAKRRIPIMIAHVENDPLIGVENAQKLYDQYAGPKRLYRLPGYGHLGGMAPGVEPLCAQWLQSLEQ